MFALLMVCGRLLKLGLVRTRHLTSAAATFLLCPLAVTTLTKSLALVPLTVVRALSLIDAMFYILHHFGIIWNAAVPETPLLPGLSTGKAVVLKLTLSAALAGTPPESVYISIVSQSM